MVILGASSTVCGQGIGADRNLSALARHLLTLITRIKAMLKTLIVKYCFKGFFISLLDLIRAIIPVVACFQHHSNALFEFFEIQSMVYSHHMLFFMSLKLNPLAAIFSARAALHIVKLTQTEIHRGSHALSIRGCAMHIELREELELILGRCGPFVFVELLIR